MLSLHDVRRPVRRPRAETPLRALVLAAAFAAWPAALRAAPQDGNPPKSPPPAGPHLKTSVDHFDFGKVPPGTTVTGQIILESTGDAALNVTRIGVQCECARLHLSTPTRPNVPIDATDGGATALTLAPGEKATLDLRVDTTKLASGSFSKRCLIFSNEAEKSPLSITFTVQIEAAKPAEVPAPKAPAPHDDTHRPEPASDDEEHAPPPTPITTSGPPGKIESDSYKHDFGEVFRGEKLHHTFTLKNSGPGELALQEVRNSCSCSAATLRIGDKVLTQEEIKKSKLLGVLKPGESAQLEVELRTATSSVPGRDQPLQKLVRVYHNDPTLNPLILTLEATMVTPFELEPEKLDFGRVTRGKGGKATTILSGGKLGDFKVLSVKSPNEEIVKVHCEKIAGDDVTIPAYRIDAELDKSAPLGTYVNHVEVEIDHDRVKEISVPLMVTVLPNVNFVGNTKDGSDRLDFGVLKGDNDTSIELKIENGDASTPYVPKSVNVDVRPSNDAFKAELVEIEKGMKYVVRITAPKAMSKARFFQGTLEITADYADLPVKKVSFRGWFKHDEK